MRYQAFRQAFVMPTPGYVLTPGLSPVWLDKSSIARGSAVRSRDVGSCAICDSQRLRRQRRRRLCVETRRSAYFLIVRQIWTSAEMCSAWTAPEQTFALNR